MTKVVLPSMLLIAVLSSCAVPSSGSYQQVSNADIPFGLNAPQTTIPQTTTTYIYSGFLMRNLVLNNLIFTI